MCSAIITSIPPVFTRTDAQGREIGDAYLARCVQSWRACGFDPVTVNSEAEDLHPLIPRLGVEVVRVPRDARAITGRPHVFLSDLLDAAHRVSAQRVFIVNADIELEMSDAARHRLARLGPMEALGLRRRDHQGAPSPDVPPYAGGIDLVGAGVPALDGIDAGALVFGMPRWDHYLPLMLLSRGVMFLPQRGMRAWHLDHDGNWSRHHHIRSGTEFLRLLDGTEIRSSRTPEIARYLAALDRIREGDFGRSPRDRLQNRLLAGLVPKSPLFMRRVLRAVSNQDIDMLDQIAEAGA